MYTHIHIYRHVYVYDMYTYATCYRCATGGRRMYIHMRGAAREFTKGGLVKGGFSKNNEHKNNIIIIMILILILVGYCNVLV